MRNNNWHLYSCVPVCMTMNVCIVGVVVLYVLMYTTSQNPDNITKLIQPLLDSTCLNMKGFSFTLLPDWLFSLFLYLCFLNKAHDRVRFQLSQPKNNRHTKKQEKQIDGLILQRCVSKYRNKALFLNQLQKRDTWRIYHKKEFSSLCTPVIFSLRQTG